jgi:hypothetical protein
MTLRVKICELHQITPTPAKLDCAFSADFSAYIACPAHVIRTSQANTNPTEPSAYIRRASSGCAGAPMADCANARSALHYVDARGSTTARKDWLSDDRGRRSGLSASSI